MTATVFFPDAREPAAKPMALSVRRDATVEEVLGFALWSYWEAGWLPRLDEDPNAPEERLSAVGWVMKIAEDDGEVDEDFPRKSTFAPLPVFRKRTKAQAQPIFFFPRSSEQGVENIQVQFRGVRRA
jgi:hypothetical protein